jgi:ribosomal protein L24E
MHRLIAPYLCLVGFSMAGAAHAAGSATISGNDGSSVRMEYAGNMLSMDVAGQGEGRMVLRDGKMYVITDGMVLDAGSMMGIVGQQAPDLGADDVDQFKSLSATGRSETVAGVKGEIHMLEYVDGRGQSQRKEIVLSSDARAVALAKAMMNMATTMAELTDSPKAAGNAELEAAMKGKGFLRVDNDFKVVSFGEAPPASRFELPSEPQQMPNLQGLMGGGANADAQQDGGGFMGGLFGDKAKRQQERVEQRTDAEVDEATDSMVDKAMDKAFGKLFGD